MPREQRKRGRRHKKTDENENDHVVYEEEYYQPGEASHTQPPQAGPSHVEEDLNYPFGILDPDVKAYFRNVDDKLKSWNSGLDDEADEAGLVEGEDPNETRRAVLNAALEELSGKELQASTDPDCSVVLERMIYSMDDFSRRVFCDRLAGAFTQLACHRFASHVCQTLLTLSPSTVSRETQGVISSASTTSEHGELRTMSELVRALHAELLPSLGTVVLDPFGAHVLGALVILLCGDRIPLTSSHSATVGGGGMVRSKKSSKYRAKQGPMTGVLSTPDFSNFSSTTSVPADFSNLAVRLVGELKEQMDPNSVRSLAAHKAANPLVQLLLQVEARSDLASQPGSVMDSFLVGLAGEIKDGTKDVQASDYVETMLRDATASHILETILAVAPEDILHKLWEVYFRGKLPKLAVHPVANFVLASAVGRLNGEELGEVWEEMQGRWAGVLKNNRTGGLRAAVARAADLDQGDQAIEAVKSTFGFSDTTDKKNIVPCMLTCMPYTTFKEQKMEVLSMPSKTDDSSAAQPPRKKPIDSDPINLQGSLLLQSLLHLPSPSNALILDSLESLSTPERVALAHHPTSARVIDGLLDSGTVPNKNKRMWISGYLGVYHELVDDRIGSRVGDLCWAKADTFLKEKIARSLIKHETFLAASHYGRFFARKLRLTLLQRKPEDWKAAQSSAAPALTAGNLSPNKTETNIDPSGAASLGPAVTKKRKSHAEGDEIDALFTSAAPRTKKPKPAHAEDQAQERRQPSSKAETILKEAEADQSLAGVLDAIKQTRTHEKGEESRPKKKRKA
ncbi:ARM repeat-containing protein [Dacryopinax primogenitus]|uniref:Nucleolar protein 9 n=1 Tax=Dacryopinax primogenitus (strain DJM 731) TaxID=1858805 RepID=M5GH17_DACPD|nr:ARM repeat-containing protein [Dacryopinax primogenitus]EJU06458.1 ARM repeat-containing protein [Dacryopinax primogenitus]